MLTRPFHVLRPGQITILRFWPSARSPTMELYSWMLTWGLVCVCLRINRASELSALRWEQVDLVHGLLHVARVQNGMPSVHPLRLQK
jgi:hypothetical protein